MKEEWQCESGKGKGIGFEITNTLNEESARRFGVLREVQFGWNGGKWKLGGSNGSNNGEFWKAESNGHAQILLAERKQREKGAMGKEEWRRNKRISEAMGLLLLCRAYKVKL